MSKPAADLNQLDAYLARIEARERKSRRRRLLAGVLIVGALSGGALAFRYLDRPAPVTTYALADLNATKVRDLLADHPQGILVHDPEFGADTVHDAADFEEMVSLLAMIRGAREQEMAPADTLLDEVTASLPLYPVDIEGRRAAGRKLVFTIENFDPAVSYILDFGNGYRQRVRRQALYTYPNAGVFRLQLLAYSQDRGNSIYVKELTIDPGTSGEEVIAEVSPQEKPALTPPPTQDAPSVDTAAQLALARTLRPVNATNRPEAPLAPTEAAGDYLPQPVLESNPAQPGTAQPRSTQVTETGSERNMKAMLIADLMPEFPGGAKGLSRYIRRTIRYPEAAADQGIEGSVYVRFIVQPDGRITEPVIVQGIGNGCDEEALRIVSGMPRWIPGEHGGAKVPVYKTIAIAYRLVD